MLFQPTQQILTFLGVFLTDLKERNDELKIDGEIDEWVIQIISRRAKSLMNA